MIAPLDVFAVKISETAWLGCGESLHEAFELIRNAGAGSYFIFSQRTGNKNFFDVSLDGVISQVLSAHNAR